MSLSTTERERLKKDIVNHAIEEIEVGAGEEMTSEEISELKETLSEQSDEELENWWHGNVGEWIAPMTRWNNGEYQKDGVPIWEYHGFETVIHWQLNKLLEEGKTDYGYIRPLYTQPY